MIQAGSYVEIDRQYSVFRIDRSVDIYAAGAFPTHAACAGEIAYAQERNVASAHRYF